MPLKVTLWPGLTHTPLSETETLMWEWADPVVADCNARRGPQLPQAAEAGLYRICR